MVSCAPLFDFTHPAHWRVQPFADARPVALADRGIPALGHFGRPETCPACTPGARAPVGARMLPTPARPRPVVPPWGPSLPLAGPVAPPAPPEALPGPQGAAPEPPPPGPVGRPLVEVFADPPPARAPKAKRTPRRRTPRSPFSQATAVVVAAVEFARAKLGRAPDKLGGLWRVRIPIEAIVVAVWRTNPDAFGLRKFKGLHPDSRRVMVVLSRRNGPVVRGQLKRVGPNHVRVTAEGLREFMLARAQITATAALARRLAR